MTIQAPRPAGQRSIAVYWDFENIHIPLLKNQKEKPGRNDQQPRIVDVRSVMEFVRTEGRVTICKAYNDWTLYGSYKECLLEENIELIQLYARGSKAKNGADIRLVADALADLSSYHHLTDVFVITGDSDYTALAQHTTRLGIFITGIGVQGATSRYWIDACDDFRYYHSLLPVEDSRLEAAGRPSIPPKTVEIIKRAVRELTENRPDGKCLLAGLKPRIKVYDRTFEPSNFEFRDMSTLLKSLSGVISIEKGEHDSLVSLKAKK